jgi:hypothetical protein
MLNLAGTNHRHRICCLPARGQRLEGYESPPNTSHASHCCGPVPKSDFEIAEETDMFARVVTLHGQPNKLHDGIRTWEERISSVESLKGFKNAYFLTDRKTGKCTVVSLWDTEEDLNASTNVIIPIRDAVSMSIGASGQSILEGVRGQQRTRSEDEEGGVGPFLPDAECARVLAESGAFC